MDYGYGMRPLPAAPLALAASFAFGGCGPSTTPNAMPDATPPDTDAAHVSPDGAPPPDATRPPPAGYFEALALPHAVDRNPDPHIIEVDISAGPAHAELLPGKTTALWTYNGTMPGPLIEANVGDRLIMHFTNRLPEDTIVHAHGVRTPNPMDGSAMTQATIPEGGTFDYDYVLPDAGLFWYHPHQRSNVQLARGLYGAILVHDPAEPPALGDADEAVVVLDDIMLEDDGRLAPDDDGGALGDIFGREGNILLVNGRVHPTVPVRAGRPLRWRVLNAAGARYFEVDLAGQTAWLVGTDGGLLEHPVPITSLLLEPASRADVIIVPTAHPGTDVELRWMPFDRGYLTGNRDPEPLMSLHVVDGPDNVPERHAPPAADLRTIAPILDTGAATPHETLVLGEKAVGEGLQLTFNDVPYPPGLELHTPTDTTAIWTLDNQTDGGHPFHLHGFFFQVLDVAGVPPAYRSWRDTFHIPPHTVVRLGIPFDGREGVWMFHCHILDHAEIGMMGHVHTDAPVPTDLRAPRAPPAPPAP